MVSLYSGFYVGLNGINAARAGLNVTGNNIANVNTEGYSRQTAELAARRDSQSGNLLLGTGVDIQKISSARDRLVETSLTRQVTQFGYQDELYQRLRQVEGMMEESDLSGLTQSFKRFFSGLEEAAVRPDQLSARRELLESADSLSMEMKSRYRSLDEFQRQTNLEIKGSVEQINELTDQLAVLNVQISSQANTPQNLVDERQRLINQLSDMAGIDVFELNNNLVQINLKNTGYILVGISESTHLGTQLDPGNFNYYDVTYPVNGVTTDISNDLNFGRLEAKLQIRDTELPALKRRLDNLAAGFIQNVNAIHQGGIAMDGVTTGLNFFTPFVSGLPGPDNNRGAAANMSVSVDVLDTPANIALSLTGELGDNQVGNQLAALRQAMSVIDSDGDNVYDTGSFESYFQETLGGLGSVLYSAKDSQNATEALLKQAENRKSEVSSVSLDEEAVKLTQFQRAFQASSKFISVIDQLTSDIINQLG